MEKKENIDFGEAPIKEVITWLRKKGYKSLADTLTEAAKRTPPLKR